MAESASVIASSKRASRVVLTSSTVGQLHLGQRLAGGLLDRLQQVALARGDERDRVAAAAGPAGAADAVHVGLGVGRDVVVDDVADPVDVEAAGRDVGGDQDVELALLELVDRLLALGLHDVAVDRRRGEAAGPQLLGQRLGLVLGADEDDHPLEVLDLEDPGEGVDLLRVGHHQVALGDVGGRAVLFLTVISTGSRRYFFDSRRIWAGIVAENSATCLSAGRARPGSSRRPRRSPC